MPFNKFNFPKDIRSLWVEWGGVCVCKSPRLAIFHNPKSSLMPQRRLLPENMTCKVWIFSNPNSSASLNQIRESLCLPPELFTLEPLIVGIYRYILHFNVHCLLSIVCFCWCFLRYANIEPFPHSLYFFSSFLPCAWFY